MHQVLASSNAKAPRCRDLFLPVLEQVRRRYLWVVMGYAEAWKADNFSAVMIRTRVSKSARPGAPANTGFAAKTTHVRETWATHCKLCLLLGSEVYFHRLQGTGKPSV